MSSFDEVLETVQDRAVRATLRALQDLGLLGWSHAEQCWVVRAERGHKMSTEQLERSLSRELYRGRGQGGS